jgi:predicted dehydrogenase
MNEPNSQKSIGLAFVGCGHITAKHSKTVDAIEKNVRKYYASRDERKAKEYNTQYEGVGFFDSYESAFQSSEVDAVFIATPPNSHLEFTQQALEAGKHVIVEKPPFMISGDFERIRTVKEKQNLLVMVAENYFYKPLTLEIRKLLRNGIIGDILIIHINALKYQQRHDWRNELDVTGGGALFEGGIHWINFMSNMGLTVKSVHGFQPSQIEALERTMVVEFEYEEGAIGTLYYSWEVPTMFKGLRISRVFGRKGSVTFESNGIFIFVRGKKQKLIFPGFKDIAGYRGMFRDFFSAIRSNIEPQFTFDMAKRDVEIIEKAYKTAKH